MISEIKLLTLMHCNILPIYIPRKKIQACPNPLDRDVTISLYLYKNLFHNIILKFSHHVA